MASKKEKPKIEHRVQHRFYRSAFLVGVLVLFFILFGIFNTQDATMGLFIAFICGVGCFIIYELMIIPKLKTTELKENSAHQIFIGGVAMSSAFVSFLLYMILRIDIQNILMIMAILTLVILFIGMPKFDRHMHKLLR